MDTLITERHGRIFMTNAVRVIRDHSDISDDLAAEANWELEQANPFIKWLSGDFVEADNPNSNTQFWTKDDLALSEYSIKYAPLNMLHKQTTPVGFFASSRMVNIADKAANGQGTAKVEALAGMWSHVFPFEAALIDQADELGQLFFSMECRGTHLHCTGPNGCDQSFAYGDENQCAHLKERTSIRHIVNPTFRGGALIIPPVRPGWQGATASVYEDAIKDEAQAYAELTQRIFEQANSGGADLSASAWEHLMAEVLTLAN